MLMLFKICLLLCNLIICSEGQRSVENSDDDDPESAINLPINTPQSPAVFPQSLNQVVVIYDIRQHREQQIELRLVPELSAENGGAGSNAGGAAASVGRLNLSNAFLASLPPSGNRQFFVSLSGGLIPFTRRFRPMMQHHVPEVFERSPLMDYITSEADLNLYLTQQATLLNEDPIQFLDYVTTQFRQAILNGRSSVTKQEVLNWIHATIGSIRAQHLALGSSDELTSEQRLAVDIGVSGLRPFFVQRETDAMMRHNRTRPPCLSLQTGENYESANLIDSLTTWQSRFDQARLAEHLAEYNQILAMGDTVVCPFGEGEQCLVTRSQAYRFLELQQIELQSLNMQDRQFLIANDYLTGQELVNIIARSK
jgi:hypothetical protein